MGQRRGDVVAGWMLSQQIRALLLQPLFPVTVCVFTEWTMTNAPVARPTPQTNQKPRWHFSSNGMSRLLWRYEGFQTEKQVRTNKIPNAAYPLWHPGKKIAPVFINPVSLFAQSCSSPNIHHVAPLCASRHTLRFVARWCCDVRKQRRETRPQAAGLRRTVIL